MLRVTIVWTWLVVGLAFCNTGCDDDFPTCDGSGCSPCLECDQLIGLYDGMLTGVTNDCLGDSGGDPPDQPYSLSIDVIHYDEADDRTYVEYDFTGLTPFDIGIVQADLCGPSPQKDGSVRYAFCMSVSYEGYFGTDSQTTTGDFIEKAGQPIRFEGHAFSLTNDPVNGECHISGSLDLSQ